MKHIQTPLKMIVTSVKWKLDSLQVANIPERWLPKQHGRKQNSFEYMKFLSLKMKKYLDH